MSNLDSKWWLLDGDLYVWGNYIVNRNRDRLWSLRYQELMPKLCECPTEVQEEITRACLAKQKEWIETQKSRTRYEYLAVVLETNEIWTNGKIYYSSLSLTDMDFDGLFVQDYLRCQGVLWRGRKNSPNFTKEWTIDEQVKIIGNAGIFRRQNGIGNFEEMGGLEALCPESLLETWLGDLRKQLKAVDYDSSSMNMLVEGRGFPG